MDSTKMTVEEMTQSLTGFEELEIPKHFPVDLANPEQSPSMFLRALVYVQRRRGGLDERTAKDAVMNLPLKAVNEAFVDDDEVTPDEPVTVGGKDD